jgi:methionine-rich copper-binding protein CopC
MAVTWRRASGRDVPPALLALVVWLALAVTVAAHSDLVSSSPVAGSTVAWTPGMSVVLSFSEPLKSGSKADVVGSSGTTVGTATVDPTDNTRLTWLPPTALAPGSWTIRWTSIATDGDVLRGTIPFAVAAATPAPSLAGATALPSASPFPSPTPADASAAGIGAIIRVVAALLAIALLALLLLRNRRPAVPR